MNTCMQMYIFIYYHLILLVTLNEAISSYVSNYVIDGRIYNMKINPTLRTNSIYIIEYNYIFIMLEIVFQNNIKNENKT